MSVLIQRLYISIAYDEFASVTGSTSTSHAHPLIRGMVASLIVGLVLRTFSACILLYPIIVNDTSYRTTDIVATCYHG